MVNTNIDIVMNARGDAFDKFNKLTKVTRKVNSQFNNTNKILNIATKSAERYSKTLEKANSVALKGLFAPKKAGIVSFWDKLNNQTLAFNGNLLSIMFLGMAMQRVFGGALKSIFEGYKKVLPENHAFIRQTNQLSGAWQFFKFTLADVVANSPIFKWLLDGIISIINKWSEMPDWVKFSTVALLAVGAIVGGLFAFIGVLGLGFAGIANISMGFEGMANLGKSAIGGINAAFLKKLGIILAVLAVMKLMKDAYDTYATSSDDAKKRTDALKDAYIGLANSGIKPLNSLFGDTDKDIKSTSELMVWFGSLVTSIFAAIGNSLSLLVAVWRTGFNALQLAATGATQVILLAYEAYVKWQKLGSWVDAKATGDWSAYKRFDNEDKKIDRLRENLNKFTREDIKDVKDAWKDFGQNAVNFSSVIESPMKAVEQYRKEVAKLESDKKVDAFFGLLNNVGSNTNLPVNNLMNELKDIDANLVIPNLNDVVGKQSAAPQPILMNFYNEGMFGIEGKGAKLNSAVQDELQDLGVLQPTLGGDTQ